MPKAEVAGKIVPIIEDPSLAGQTHWTAVKLHGWIAPLKVTGEGDDELAVNREASI